MPTLERDGVVLHYSRTGAGPPVILVQGVGVIGDGWLPQVADLRQRFDVVTVDNRGIGRSTIDDRQLEIADMAADVLAIADAEGFDRFHLAGHSMGGIIAQHIALTATSRILTLALICTFAKGRQGTTIAPGLLATALRARIGTRRMRRRAFVELVMPRDYLKTQERDGLCSALGAVFGRDLADQPPIIMRQLRAMGRFDATATLGTLASIPTLVVSAAHDCIARPSYGRALAAAIPAARHIEVPGAGHAVTIQCAAEINDLLAEHFSRSPVTARRTA